MFLHKCEKFGTGLKWIVLHVVVAYKYLVHWLTDDNDINRQRRTYWESLTCES